MSHIFIALGSNLGDRLDNLQSAVDFLDPSVDIISQSHIYETLPWGITEQPFFLNQVIEVDSPLSPQNLLILLKQIEQEMGREPAVRYGPRQIDLDILFFNNLIFYSPELIIPHPRLHERAFVLVPLADIAPEFVHPIYHKTVIELLAKLDRSGVNPFEMESQ